MKNGVFFSPPTSFALSLSLVVYTRACLCALRTPVHACAHSCSPALCLLFFVSVKSAPLPVLFACVSARLVFARVFSAAAEARSASVSFVFWLAVSLRFENRTVPQAVTSGFVYFLMALAFLMIGRWLLGDWHQSLSHNIVLFCIYKANQFYMR